MKYPFSYFNWIAVKIHRHVKILKRQNELNHINLNWYKSTCSKMAKSARSRCIILSALQLLSNLIQISLLPTFHAPTLCQCHFWCHFYASPPHSVAYFASFFSQTYQFPLLVERVIYNGNLLIICRKKQQDGMKATSGTMKPAVSKEWHLYS